MKAYSLIELLAVMAILAIVAAFAAPAVNDIVRGGAISRGGQLVADQIALARQEAATKNRDVEVRIFDDVADSQTLYTGIQLWIADDSGTMTKLTRLERLPEGVVVSADATLSPLLGLLSGSADVGGQTFPYGGFRLRARGIPDSTINLTNNFLTVQPSRQTTGLGKNFFTVRLQPLTARIETYRP